MKRINSNKFKQNPMLIRRINLKKRWTGCEEPFGDFFLIPKNAKDYTHLFQYAVELLNRDWSEGAYSTLSDKLATRHTVVLQLF